MAAFGIHELRKQTEEEFPDADYGDAFGRTRDKVVSAVKGANIGERVGEQASKLRLPEKRPSRRAPTSEAPTAVTPANAEDARLQRLERLGLAAREGHPHRRGVRGREVPAARRPTRREPESPPPGSNRQPPDYKSGALPG